MLFSSKSRPLSVSVQPSLGREKKGSLVIFCSSAQTIQESAKALSLSNIFLCFCFRLQLSSLLYIFTGLYGLIKMQINIKLFPFSFVSHICAHVTHTTTIKTYQSLSRYQNGHTSHLFWPNRPKHLQNIYLSQSLLISKATKSLIVPILFCTLYRP